MTGWESKRYNPITDAPKSPTMAQERETEGPAVTLNGQSVTLPWPFLVGEANVGYPSIDILTD